MERGKSGKIVHNDLLPPPAVNATKPRTKTESYPVCVYHIGSEQLRKSYDNFGEILVCVATYLTKT